MPESLRAAANSVRGLPGAGNEAELAQAAEASRRASDLVQAGLISRVDETRAQPGSTVVGTPSGSRRPPRRRKEDKRGTGGKGAEFRGLIPIPDTSDRPLMVVEYPGLVMGTRRVRDWLPQFRFVQPTVAKGNWVESAGGSLDVEFAWGDGFVAPHLPEKVAAPGLMLRYPNPAHMARERLLREGVPQQELPDAAGLEREVTDDEVARAEKGAEVIGHVQNLYRLTSPADLVGVGNADPMDDIRLSDPFPMADLHGKEPSEEEEREFARSIHPGRFLPEGF